MLRDDSTSYEAFEGTENTEEFLDDAETKVFKVADNNVNNPVVPIKPLLQ